MLLKEKELVQNWADDNKRYKTAQAAALTAQRVEMARQLQEQIDAKIKAEERENQRPTPRRPNPPSLSPQLLLPYCGRNYTRRFSAAKRSP
jgi:hypothetical protein